MSNYKRLKCKDYFIIKLRYYSSPYYLKLFKNNKEIGNIKHMESAKNFHNYFWKFIEKVTSKNDYYFHTEYIMRGFECAIEEIFETHGIYVSQSEGYYKFMIPKEHNDIIEWVKDSIDIPYKIIKKTQTGLVRVEPDTWRREMYKTKNK